jgi:hypothetical protein
VASEALNVRVFRWILLEFQILIVVVHIVSNSEELLLIVRACD